MDLLAYFTVPFALLLAIVARSPFPDWAPRAMARAAVALGTLFAVIGLYQAATRDLFFYAPNLEVSNANSNFFRVTSLFGDPSLYGRHVVLAMTVLLVCLALQRIDLRLGIGLLVVLWLGLFFSYSQSSMVALVCVTLAIAFVTGGPGVRRLVAGGLLVAILLGRGVPGVGGDPGRVAAARDQRPHPADHRHHPRRSPTTRSWAWASAASPRPAGGCRAATVPPPTSSPTPPR